MRGPPERVVAAAAKVAMLSPCEKSKRGVVIYSGAEFTRLLATGYNSPPAPMTCGGDTCRSHCRNVAVHAEERAVREMAPWPGAISQLVHVKVDPARWIEGRGTAPWAALVVAGGPPSCVTCSRTILDSGAVSHVWLLEAQDWHEEFACTACGQMQRVAKGESTTCPKCRSGSTAELLRTDYEPDGGVWKRYTALEFHARTLFNLHLYGGFK